MNSWFPEHLFIHANLRKKRRPQQRTEIEIRHDAEEQALVKEVREAKVELEDRLNELKTWRRTYLTAY